MVLIQIPYIILEQGKTKNLMEDRNRNPDIFADCDDETLLEEIDNWEHYYKVKFPKYPIIGIDIDGLCEWSIQNNYSSLATPEEKSVIKWDGTKKHLLEKGENGNVVPRVFLKKRLKKWAENKQIIDCETGLLTEDSPTIPNLSLFYKKLEDGPDRIEWIFPCEIVNSNVYYYTRTKLIDSKTYKPIEPIII